jgi:ParB-like chromosome segregation protein Spo0J
MPKTKSRDERVRTDGYEVVGVETLEPYPGNARRHDIESIRESIRENGLIGAINVQTSTRFILDGNGTYEALREEGIEEVPVCWVDVDDDRARRIVLAMNRAHDLGYYDNTALAALLAQAGDDDDALAGSLYASADLDALRAALSTSGSGHGETRDAMTPQERQEAHDASPIRSIILPLGLDDYEDTIARLVRLREAWDMETNAEVILHALAVAEDAEGA